MSRPISNFHTFVSWMSDLSLVAWLYIFSFNAIGATYSGPPAEAWHALDSCGDCYIRLAKFLAQNLDSLMPMFFFAFFRFVVIWALIDIIKLVVVREVPILYAYYCARRQEHSVDDNKRELPL